MAINVARREFLAVLSSAAAAWPLAAQGQKAAMSRVGVLLAYDESDSVAKDLLSEFTRGLAELGWTNGHNLRMDTFWAGVNADRIRTLAKELISLQPDVILANSTPVTNVLRHETRTIPIVFVIVSDPVGDGIVASLSRPGGNITGFGYAEAGLAGKLLGLLTEIVPGIKRAAAMFNPDTVAGGGSYYLPSFEAAARSLQVTPIAAPIHNDAEIERVITSLGRELGSGLVQIPDNFLQVHSAQIISLAAQNNVPTIYFAPRFVRDGGLLSYGPEYGDIFRRAAFSVDRILRGEKPADIPVQLPVKFWMALNTKSAEALGLTISASFLLRVDEVVE
jgi:putative tryptophan/tyrosine transport system substrate-binding protein